MDVSIILLTLSEIYIEPQLLSTLDMYINTKVAGQPTTEINLDSVT